MKWKQSHTQLSDNFSPTDSIQIHTGNALRNEISTANVTKQDHKNSTGLCQESRGWLQRYLSPLLHKHMKRK
jgi:hypothetical protein